MNNYTNICPDASLVVRLLLNDEEGTPIDLLWQGWFQSGVNLIAPTLLFYEVSNALYRYVIHRQLTRDEVEKTLTAAMQLGIQLHGDPNLHLQALSLAQELGLPATYDAHYLALAKRSSARFWTADQRLFNSIQGKLSWVNIWT